MLEILGMRFTAAEVVVVTENPTQSVEVGLKIENIMKHDDATVSIVFAYHLNYLPDVASVRLKGIAFCTDTPQNVKHLVEAWEKKKEVPPELCASAINMINANASVTALFLTRPFGLVPHLMPPPLFMAPGEAGMPEEKKGGKKAHKKGGKG